MGIQLYSVKLRKSDWTSLLSGLTWRNDVKHLWADLNKGQVHKSYYICWYIITFIILRFYRFLYTWPFLKHSLLYFKENLPYDYSSWLHFVETIKDQQWQFQWFMILNHRNIEPVSYGIYRVNSQNTLFEEIFSALIFEHFSRVFLTQGTRCWPSVLRQVTVLSPKS